MEPTDPDVTEESAACTEILEVPGRRPVTTDYNAEEEEMHRLVWSGRDSIFLSSFADEGIFSVVAFNPTHHQLLLFFYIYKHIYEIKILIFSSGFKWTVFFGHLQR